MEEFPERAELRRMQREQERERRRIRDRQRRQSMTQEQRERHLARRRRNYQLRRQRAANNAHSAPPFIPLPQESSAGEASTSDDLQGGVTSSSTSLDFRLIGFPHHGQDTLNLGILGLQGSSVQMETLAFNSPRRLRLNHIRSLARNLTRSTVDHANTIDQVSAELLIKEDESVGNYDSPKSLRLNCVKRLARSRNLHSKENAAQNDNNLAPEEGIQLLGSESFIGTS